MNSEHPKHLNHDDEPELTSRMGSRGLKFWIVFFLIILALPGLYQASQEVSAQDGIQAFHLFYDMTIQPQKRAQTIRTSLLDLQQALAIPGNEDSTGMFWEKQVQHIINAQTAVRIVNRYISLDSTQAQLIPWTKLRQQIQASADAAALGDRATLQSLQEPLQTQINTLLNQTLCAQTPLAWILRMADAIFEYTLFSQPYLRAWENRIEKESRFALTTRPWMQMARYLIFDDLGEKGVRGRVGAPGEIPWSFYRPGVEVHTRPWVTDPRSTVVDPNDRAVNENPLQAILTFQKQLQAKGIDLLVVIVPGKPTIYPDYLSAAYEQQLDPQSQVPWLQGHGERFVDSLQEHGVATVNLFQAFRAERALDQDIQDAIYLHHDTHWTLRGLRRAAQEVAQVVQKKWPSASQPSSPLTWQAQDCQVEREGDVLEMTELPQAQFFGQKLTFPPQTVPCQQIYQVSLDSNQQEIHRKLYQDDFRHSRILILGDSFSRIYQTDAPRSAGWISHLALNLQEPLSSIVSDGGASTLVRQKLARKSKVLKGKTLVIWEFVERDLRYGAEGWKNVHL